MGRAMAPLAPFLLIAGALALVIDDLITYIQGGESAFGDFWKMFGTGDEIGARFKALWEGIKSILESVGAALKARCEILHPYLFVDWTGCRQGSRRNLERCHQAL